MCRIQWMRIQVILSLCMRLQRKVMSFWHIPIANCTAYPLLVFVFLLYMAPQDVRIWLISALPTSWSRAKRSGSSIMETACVILRILMISLTVSLCHPKPPICLTTEDVQPVPPYAIYNIGNNHPESLLDFVDILQQELI